MPAHGKVQRMDRPDQLYEISDIYVYPASGESNVATCETFGITQGMGLIAIVKAI
jgi:hypothetical protein